MEYLLIIPAIYFLINACYYLTFSVASLWKIKNENIISLNEKFNKIAVLIPAYKEDQVILNSALAALAHNYPRYQFDVIVIADQLKSSTIMTLDRLPLNVIEVKFEKSSKAKALNAALDQLTGYDMAVVLDADNVMQKNFLKEVNRSFNRGAVAMQGQRIAKNEQNNLARLDAISEGINNNIFRLGHQNLGLSSALIGSGMAFDFQLFKTYMSNIDALGGFDKELELSLLKNNVKIKYIPSAKVYDEKVSDNQSFSNQRTRWIAAQIRFGMGAFTDGLSQLVRHGNVDYFDKVLQFVFVPRLILLGTLVAFTLISIFVGQTALIISATALLSLLLALVLATPHKYFNFSTLKSLITLPLIFFSMVKAIGGYKKAATNFLHTSHSNHIPS